MTHSAPHQIKPFPRARRLVTDVGHVVQGRPVIRGLLEIDVTHAREKIREYKEQTGERLSFTAYLVACTGRAVDSHKSVHACRDWLGRLVIYDDVDISTMIEVERDEHRFPVGHIVRAANRKTVREIHDEIREVQTRPTSEKNVSRLIAISRVPSFLRRLFLEVVDRSPSWTKRLKGTAVLTSIGMFGTGAGWGLALPTHSLGITVGGIATKPGFVDGEVEPREILHVTLDFDHDIVDGAPATRFAQTFAEIVESAEALPEATS
ncbi:MAG: 2-oxo acid dehydrogenase subunit E2 [Myxococcota bacterium]